MALRLIPGRHRVNLHAIYGEFGGQEGRAQRGRPGSFLGLDRLGEDPGASGLDFNPTFFSHPLADDGFTLSHRDASVRTFWIEHAPRAAGSARHGPRPGKAAVTNLWIPDGCKDAPADRKSPRERLEESLDAAFSEAIDERHQIDAVESKLFGIGSESYVVGSHEFYLGYAVKRQKLLCLDMGHFHPTRVRGGQDQLRAAVRARPPPARQPRRPVGQRPRRALRRSHAGRPGGGRPGGFLGRTHIGLDFFDASINRIAAWAIGARNTQKCLLAALLEPTRSSGAWRTRATSPRGSP
jgi:L-rhamnose isomerase